MGSIKHFLIANNISYTQQIYHFLQDPEVHYHNYKSRICQDTPSKPIWDQL